MIAAVTDDAAVLNVPVEAVQFRGETLEVSPLTLQQIGPFITAARPVIGRAAAAITYANGPFAAAANYQYVNFSNTPGDFGTQLPGVVGLTNQNTAQLGLSYDFAVVKVFAQYMLVASQAASGNFHANTGQLGASVPLGRGSVLASVAYTGSSGSGDNQRRTTWALGYDYPLSKRTDIYAAYKYDHMSDLSTGQTYGAGLRMKF